LLLAGSLPAMAADQTQPLTLSGGPSLPVTTPAPSFHFDFLLDDPVRPLLKPSTGAADNLEITLTSPNNSAFHFLFSPRPQFGFTADSAAGINRGYAGLSWNLFNDTSGLYGNLGLGGTYDASTGIPGDLLRRPLSSPLMLHGGLELGYQFGQQHSLSLRLDEGIAPVFRLNGETSDNFRLRYGLKF
jgi:hypothetical protein